MSYIDVSSMTPEEAQRLLKRLIPVGDGVWVVGEQPKEDDREGEQGLLKTA